MHSDCLRVASRTPSRRRGLGACQRRGPTGRRRRARRGTRVPTRPQRSLPAGVESGPAARRRRQPAPARPAPPSPTATAALRCPSDVSGVPQATPGARSRRFAKSCQSLRAAAGAGFTLGKATPLPGQVAATIPSFSHAMPRRVGRGTAWLAGVLAPIVCLASSGLSRGAHKITTSVRRCTGWLDVAQVRCTGERAEGLGALGAVAGGASSSPARLLPPHVMGPPLGGALRTIEKNHRTVGPVWRSPPQRQPHWPGGRRSSGKR